MISQREALDSILERAAPLPAERRALAAASGRVLAEDVAAPGDLPRFDSSAVDGFAVRVADLRGAGPRTPKTLALAGVVRAGGRPRATTLRPGTAVKILTGAPIPRGAGAVVMKELCREGGSRVEVRATVANGENIRPRGEELRRGARVLAAGTPITPPVAGLLATLGRSSVLVHRLPRVALLATGSELVTPGRKLRPGQIYDSNSPALRAALAELGIKPHSAERVPDARAVLARSLARALRRSDVVLAIGGVSVGDYDFVKDVLEELGVESVYWKVAIKPGKPNYFGVSGRRSGGGRRRAGRRKEAPGRRAAPRALVFGLPGNPVSALVSFHELVKPALLALMGLRAAPPLVLRAALERDLTKSAGRLEWVRGVLAFAGGDPRVTPARGQGSHMLSGLAAANCLIEFPAGATLLRAGRRVAVKLLSWGA